MDAIVVTRIRCRARIGFRPHERGIEQDLFVTVRLEGDWSQAAASDDVHDGVDYRTVTKRVRRVVEAKRRDLLESAAQDVAAACLAFRRVRAVEVRIEKPGALSDAENVAVELRRAAGKHGPRNPRPPSKRGSVRRRPARGKDEAA